MVLVTFLNKVLGPGRGAEKLSLLWVRYPSMLVFEHLSNLMPGFGKRLGALTLYGSVSAGREKWPFNVLFFFKSRASV